MREPDRDDVKVTQDADNGAAPRRQHRFGRASGPVSARPHGISPGLKWGPLGIVVFWLVIMGVVYGAIKYTMKPREMTISMAGEMTITRARDGHFYAPGLVAGKPVTFLVDTGASYVTVSRSFASYAGIGAGMPTQFRTANGVIEGRIVSDVPVSLGAATVSGVKVAVGLIGTDRDKALLGQSFLSKFQITLAGNEMVLRAL